MYLGEDEAAAAVVGRDRDYELIGSVNTVIRRIRAYQSAGATGINVRCWAKDIDGYVAMLRQFALEVIPQV